MSSHPLMSLPGGLVACLLLLSVSTPGSVALAWIPPIIRHRHQGLIVHIAPRCTDAGRHQLYPSLHSRPAPSAAAGQTRLWGWFDSLSPFESKIPPELKDEIYRAEANTAAAKDRGQRVTIYACLAVLGVLLAAFNGFLTELRSHEGAATTVVAGSNTLDVLVEAGFGWVVSSPVYSFLFTNAIGGGLCLLFGGGAWLMAEAEIDTKRLNSEKIYEELQRRREEKSRRSDEASANSEKRKKRRSGKEQKRLGALSEVLVSDDNDETKTAIARAELTTLAQTDESDAAELEITEQATTQNTEDDRGILGQWKSLYEKADSMAASQALLLNKKLEDSGLVEKITDETGLRVIGREAAAKKQDEESKESAQDS